MLPFRSAAVKGNGKTSARNNCRAIGFLFLENFLEELFLFEGHLSGFLLRSFVIVSDEVKDAVDHQKCDHAHLVEAELIRLALGRFDGDDEVTQEIVLKTGWLALAHGEGENVRRLVPLKILPIQCSDPCIAHKEDAQFCLRKSQFGQYLSEDRP